MKRTDIKPGQMMVLVTRKRYGDREWYFEDITIVKIGRTYAYFGDNGARRFSFSTMHEEAYYGGRVYPDRTTFESQLAREAKWEALRNAIERVYSPPDHITTNMIERAAAALEIELNGQKESKP